MVIYFVLKLYDCTVLHHFLIYMDPQLLQVISQAVIKQLQSNVAPSLITQVAQQVLQGSSLQTPTLSHSSSLQTPTLSHSSSGLSTSSLERSSSELSTSSLQRSSSGFSTASTTSSTFASSVPSKAARALDFADIEKKLMKKKRKRRGDPVQNAIVDALTRPLMERLDSKFLAPLESCLFKRQLKKTRNPNGTRSLRKNKTMVMPLCRKLIRPIIRRILGCLDTPNASEIYSKYYRAAIKIITKRRANHVQSWRLFGEPQPLCYDAIQPSHHEQR